MQNSELFRRTMPDLTRLERLLVGLVALLLLSVLILALIVLDNRSQGLATSTTGETAQAAREQSRVVAAAPAPLTANGAYEDGLALAQNWATDAQLWRAEASWSVQAGSVSTAPGWVYTFYSHSLGQTALVNATPEKVALLRTQVATSRPSLSAVDEWQIDSSEALELALRGGGRAFLSVHERATMNLTLTAESELRWRATLIDESDSRAANKQVFRIEFSGVDGELIARPLP